jgi:cell division protein FtsB
VEHTHYRIMTLLIQHFELSACHLFYSWTAYLRLLQQCQIDVR